MTTKPPTSLPRLSPKTCDTNWTTPFEHEWVKKGKGAAPVVLYFMVAGNKGCSQREAHPSSWAVWRFIGMKTQQFCSMSVCMFWFSLLCRGACGLAAGISAFTGTSFCVSPVQEEKLDACCATSFCHPPPLWLPLPAAECYLSLLAAGADETQPRTPAVWRSCPSNVCCRAGTQTCHSCWHLLLFQSWASPLNIQSSFASVQTPHLKCHAPWSWRPLSLSFSGGHLLRRRPFWGVFFPPCPGKSCLPRCFQLLRSMRWRCSAPTPVTSQIWNQRQGSYWKESSDALTEDSVSLQWLLSARRKQPHKLSV